MLMMVCSSPSFIKKNSLFQGVTGAYNSVGMVHSASTTSTNMACSFSGWLCWFPILPDSLQRG